MIDDNTVHYLSKTILKDLNFSTVSTRPLEKQGKYFISLKILIYIFIGLCNKLNFEASYVYAYIRSTKPKIVLENTMDYYIPLLAKLFPEICFVIIKQGSIFKTSEKYKKKYKKFHWVEKMSQLKIKNLKNFYIFVWGQYDIDMINEMGLTRNIRETKLIPVGSYEGSYYSKFDNKKDLNQEILYISMLRDSYIDSDIDTLERNYYDETILSLKLLSKYVKENNLSLSFVCRNFMENDRREIDIANSFFEKNSKFKILRRDRLDLIWQEIFSSKIVVALDSTVAYDSIMLKKKTLLMPLGLSEIFIRDTNNKSVFDCWPWTMQKPDYNLLKKFLDELVLMDDKKFKDLISKKVSYYSNTEIKLPAHVLIWDFIKDKVN